MWLRGFVFLDRSWLRHVRAHAHQLSHRGITKGLLAAQAKAGLMIHSDRGSQYTSYDFRKMLVAYRMTHSMSRRGNCWDNAAGESFFTL
jgi:putative transposase